MTWSVSPGLTSSEQQARTQSRSDRTTRASMAVVCLFKASLTLTITFWCCLEKHVSGSTADTGSDVISSSSTAARSGPSVHEGRAEAEGVMAAADQQSDQNRSASLAGENRSTRVSCSRRDRRVQVHLTGTDTPENISCGPIKHLHINIYFFTLFQHRDITAPT